MKNKIIGILIAIALLSIYPIWRYSSNAKVFAEAVIAHAAGLGKWSYGSISSNFDGKNTIRNLTFSPESFEQQFTIDSAVISTSPMFLLKSSAFDLGYMLPETLSLSINSAVLTTQAQDINNTLREQSMWMLMAGYSGSFGCNRESYTSFDGSSWENILDNDQYFNIDLFYSRQENGSLDVDLTLDAENLFSTTWSSNLTSSYPDNQIIINDLIVEKLYYFYLDNGFNIKRNDACKQNYNGSFAAYRLSSAEHLQNYLRTSFQKELPDVLINWYQRMLAPDVEYNAIITLDERQYLNQVFNIDQRTLYENAVVEISTSDNEYLPVTLKEIDFTAIDSEMLKKESLKRELLKKQAEQDKLKPKVDVLKPRIYTIGAKKSAKVALNKLNTAINRKVRVKTARGRPITGVITQVDGKYLTLETSFKKGRATLTIPIDKIASVELVK
jgi:hypothetical protein